MPLQCSLIIHPTQTDTLLRQAAYYTNRLFTQRKNDFSFAMEYDGVTTAIEIKDAKNTLSTAFLEVAKTINHNLGHYPSKIEAVAGESKLPNDVVWVLHLTAESDSIKFRVNMPDGYSMSVAKDLTQELQVLNDSFYAVSGVSKVRSIIHQKPYLLTI